MKIIFNLGKAIVLISAVMLILGLFLLRSPHSFELGAALGF